MALRRRRSNTGHKRPYGFRRMERQITTIKAGLRDANTVGFSKQSATIQLPPHEQYPKIFHTVHL